jgi:ABC-type transport system involved in multi-copper enzyme maturation permease subunit
MNATTEPAASPELVPPRTGFDPEAWSRPLSILAVAAIVAGIILANLAGLTLVVVGIVLLLLASFSREHGLLLTGPFIGHELRRAVRRTRLHLWWGLLAGVCGMIVLIGYGVVVFNNYPSKEVAAVAAGVLLFIAWNLFLTIFSVTVTLLSYCIAEDRDGKRLDFLLVSDLRNREIVLGKALGRLIGGMAYPFALVPLAILVPALFGVDPMLVVLLALFCAITLTSLVGLSVYSSALAATKKSGGTVMTLFVLPYLLLSFGVQALRQYPEIWFFPGTPSNVPDVSVGDVADIIAIGNPLPMGIAWFGGGGVPNYATMIRDLNGYTAFHVGVGLIAFLAAVRVLRSRSATMTDRKLKEEADTGGVPELGDGDPIVWKERYFTKAVVQTRRRKSVRLLGAVMIVVPIVVFLLAAAADVSGVAAGNERLTVMTGNIQKGAAIYPALLGWIFAVAGSRFGLETIVRERDKDTLTSLLLSDITPRQIVAGKLRGILRLMLSSWLAVGLVGLASAACGGITVWAALGLVLMSTVYGVTFILIGLHTSANATSLEAGSRVFAWKLVPAAIAPPLSFIVIGTSTFMPTDEALIAAAVIAGILVVYALIGFLCWRGAVRRFHRSIDPAAEDGPHLNNPAKV